MNRNSQAAYQYDMNQSVYEEAFYSEDFPYSMPKKKKLRKKTKNAQRRHMKKFLGITYARGVLCLVLYGVIMVFLCAKSSMLSYNIIQLQGEIADLETENKRLAFEIQEKSSLERIAEIATTQLGMVKPDMTEAYITENIQPAQISIPEEIQTEEDNQTAFQKLYASLKKLGDQAIQSGIRFLASY